MADYQPFYHASKILLEGNSFIPRPPFMLPNYAFPLRRNVCIEPSKSCLRSTGALVELISASETSDCDTADGYGVRVLSGHAALRLRGCHVDWVRYKGARQSRSVGVHGS